MANFLATLLSGLSGTPAISNNEIEGVEVSPLPPPPPAPPPPRPPAKNPFSPEHAALAQAAAQAQAQLPRVSGGTDAGLYGFLPQKMQTGRLRDILGAIGDGILIEGGHKPIYAPRKEARMMDQALLGYDQDPEMAALRLGQTGAPDSVNQSTTMLNNIETARLREQQNQELAAYRQEQNRIRTENNLRQLGSTIVPGLLANARTPEMYAGVYDRLDAIARRNGLNATEAFGIPDPIDWTPEMTSRFGVTGGQLIGAETQREGIEQRREAAGWAHQDRQAAEGGRNARHASGQAGQDRRAAMRNQGGGGGRATPKAAPAPAVTPKGARKPLPPEAVQAYNKGTAQQRAAAKKTWTQQGYDTSKLK